MAKSKDLTGQRFGRWVVLSKEGSIARKSYFELTWNCVCDCGTTRVVRSRMLLHKTKNSRSCGCARADQQRKHPSRLKHGFSHKHPLYKIWKTMRQRCSNPNSVSWDTHGARGIKVCERWDDFTKFLEDMGGSWKHGLSIDRENNDGDYEPGNCRWVHAIVQANNTRTVKRNIVVVESNGFGEEEWRSWERSEKLSSFISSLLSNTVPKPDSVELYKWVDEYTVAIELKWSR